MKKRWKVFLSVFAAVMLLCVLAVPGMVVSFAKQKIISVLSDQTGGSVSMERFSIGFFSGEHKMSGLLIEGGRSGVVEIKRMKVAEIAVKAGILDLLGAVPVVEAVEISGADAQLTIKNASTESSEAGESPVFLVKLLTVVGRVEIIGVPGADDFRRTVQVDEFLIRNLGKTAEPGELKVALKDDAHGRCKADFAHRGLMDGACSGSLSASMDLQTLAPVIAGLGWSECPSGKIECELQGAFGKGYTANGGACLIESLSLKGFARFNSLPGVEGLRREITVDRCEGSLISDAYTTGGEIQLEFHDDAGGVFSADLKHGGLLNGTASGTVKADVDLGTLAPIISRFWNGECPTGRMKCAFEGALGETLTSNGARCQIDALTVEGVIRLNSLPGFPEFNRQFVVDVFSADHLSDKKNDGGKLEVKLHDEQGGSFAMQVDHHGLLDGSGKMSFQSSVELATWKPLMEKYWSGPCPTGRLECAANGTFGEKNTPNGGKFFIDSIRLSGAVNVASLPGVKNFHKTFTIRGCEINDVSDVETVQGTALLEIEDGEGCEARLRLRHRGLLKGDCRCDVSAGVDVASLAPVLAEYWEGEWPSGRVDCEAGGGFSMGENGWEYSFDVLRITGAVSVRSLPGLAKLSRTLTIRECEITGVGNSDADGTATLKIDDGQGMAFTASVTHQGLVDGMFSAKARCEINLPGLSPALTDYWNGVVESGRLICDLDVARDEQFSYGGVVRLQQMSLLEPDGKTMFCSLDELECSVPEVESEAHRWSLKSLKLKGMDVRLRRLEDGRLNAEALRKPKSSEQRLITRDEGGVADVWIQSLECVDGAVSYWNGGEVTGLEKISCAANDVSWNSAVQGVFSLQARLSGAEKSRFTVDGSMGPLKDGKATGKYGVEDVPLSCVNSLLGDFLKARVKQGNISARGAFEYDGSDTILSCDMKTTDVGICGADGKSELAGWKQLEIRLPKTRFPADMIQLGEIMWEEPRIYVELLPDGKINFSELAASKRGTPVSATTATVQEKVPHISVDRLQCKNGTLTYLNTAMNDRPGKLADFEGTLENFAYPEMKTPCAFSFSAKASGEGVEFPLSGKGTIQSVRSLSMEGSVQAGPGKFAATGELLMNIVKVRPLSGEGSIRGKFSSSEKGFVWDGVIQADALDVVESDGQTPFFKVAKMTADGAVFWDERREIAVRQVKMNDPVFNVMRNTNGRLVMQDLVAVSAKKENLTKTPATASEKGLRVTLGVFEIVNGQVRYVDKGVGTKITLCQVRELDVKLQSRESSTPGTAYTLSVGGVVPGGGGVNGSLALNADIVQNSAGRISFTGRADFLDWDLEPWSPYTEKNNNVKIKGGRLYSGVELLCKEDRLDSRAKIAVRGLNLEKAKGGVTGKMMDIAADTIFFFMQDTKGFITLDAHATGTIYDADFGVDNALQDVIAGGPGKMLKEAGEFLKTAGLDKIKTLEEALKNEVGELIKQLDFFKKIPLPKFPGFGKQEKK